jgi:hypothetical protein
MGIMELENGGELLKDIIQESFLEPEVSRMNGAHQRTADNDLSL